MLNPGKKYETIFIEIFLSSDVVFARLMKSLKFQNKKFNFKRVFNKNKNYQFINKKLLCISDKI